MEIMRYFQPCKKIFIKNLRKFFLSKIEFIFFKKKFFEKIPQFSLIT